jgi:hypothetical protein
MINCHLSCLFICTYLFCQLLTPVLNINVWLWKWSLPHVGWLITAYNSLSSCSLRNLAMISGGPTEVAEKAREPAETQENLQQQAAMAAVNAAINAARTGGSTSWAEIRPFSWRIDGENDQKNMDFWGCLMILDAFCPNLWPLLASYSWGELPKNRRIWIFSDRPSCQTIMSNLQDHASQFLFDARWGWGTEFSARCPYDPYGYGQYGSRFLPFGSPWKITIIHLEMVYFHGQFLLAATLSKIAQGYQQLDWIIDKFGWWWCFGTQMVQIWWPSGPQIVNP